MNDLVPITLFVGCLLACIGLVGVCDWLRPTSQPRDRPAHTSTPEAAP